MINEENKRKLAKMKAKIYYYIVVESEKPTEQQDIEYLIALTTIYKSFLETEKEIGGLFVK